MTITIIAFFVSLLLAYAAVPILMSFARRVGLVDHPDNNRKLHRDAIPMVGGLALFFAATTTVALMFWWGTEISQLISPAINGLTTYFPAEFLHADFQVHPDDYFQLLGLFIGSAMLLAVGLADDRFGIRGRQKLLGQILAITVLILFGYEFSSFQFLGITIEFGVFSVLVVYAWMVAAINSVNLLDGADGIASTIGIVMSIAICVMSLTLGKYIDAIVAISIAGALLGFLKFNFPPAKAYLGDSGSMLIGFLLGAIAIRCTFKQPSAYAFFAPVALLAIPFIDTGAAIVRRRLTGRSIFTVDRGHLHHALMKRGYSPRVSLLWVALLCTTTAAGGVLALVNHQSEYALVSIAIVLAVMVGCKIFGLAELRLVSRRANSIAKSFFNVTSLETPDVLKSSVHVQGSRDWQEVWKLVCDFADEHRLSQLTMDINAPWLHESFHATLKRADLRRGENKEWFSVIPLISEKRVFGRIEIHGSHDQKISHHEVIENILKVTCDIEQLMIETEPSAAVVTNPDPVSTPAGTSA